jgi:histidinol phosphatase-like enzyme
MLEACRQVGCDPREAYVIGDNPSDMMAATNVGARGIRVMTGVVAEVTNDHGTAADLLQAVLLVTGRGHDE